MEGGKGREGGDQTQFFMWISEIQFGTWLESITEASIVSATSPSLRDLSRSSSVSMRSQTSFGRQLDCIPIVHLFTNNVSNGVWPIIMWNVVFFCNWTNWRPWAQCTALQCRVQGKTLTSECRLIRFRDYSVSLWVWVVGLFREWHSSKVKYDTKNSIQQKVIKLKIQLTIVQLENLGSICRG